MTDGAPDPDFEIEETVRIKIRHYHNIYLNRPDPIAFLPLEVDTSVLLYNDLIHLLFLHTVVPPLGISFAYYKDFYTS